MVGGHSVLQAVRAAGVLADVAAEGAHALARGIGRVEEPVLREDVLELEVDDSGLNDRALIGIVEVEDAVHACERKHRPAPHRDRPAAETGRRSTRDDRDPRFSAQLDGRGDLLGRLGQDGDIRHPLVERAVVAVERQPQGIVHHGVMGHHRAQAVSKTCHSFGHNLHLRTCSLALYGRSP